MSPLLSLYSERTSNSTVAFTFPSQQPTYYHRTSSYNILITLILFVSVFTTSSLIQVECAEQQRLNNVRRTVLGSTSVSEVEESEEGYWPRPPGSIADELLEAADEDRLRGESSAATAKEIIPPPFWAHRGRDQQSSSHRLSLLLPYLLLAQPPPPLPPTQTKLKLQSCAVNSHFVDLSAVANRIFYHPTQPRFILIQRKDAAIMGPQQFWSRSASITGRKRSQIL